MQAQQVLQVPFTLIQTVQILSSRLFSVVCTTLRNSQACKGLRIDSTCQKRRQKQYVAFAATYHYFYPAGSPRTDGGQARFPISKLKLDNLFLQWLSMTESQNLVLILTVWAVPAHITFWAPPKALFHTGSFLARRC